jgi:hypothetical protein
MVVVDYLDLLLLLSTTLRPVAEVVGVVEDDTVAATAMARKRLEAQVLRVNKPRAKVRPEREKKTKDDLKVTVVAVEAFTEEAGTEAEADGVTMDVMDLTTITDHMDAEALLLHSGDLVLHLT